jgi:cytochrome P450
MSFKPERFLSTEDHIPEPDPHKLSFGFGRRVCPGRLFAKSALYIKIAQILAVFNIDKGIENGQKLDPEVKFLSGVISHPAPFKIAIKPRSPRHEALIRSIEKIHPWQKSDAEVLESIPH